MGKTKISWTNQTWNPVTGCSHVSEGCRHCYAETLSLRYKYTNKPWTAQNAAENVVLHPERLDQPLHWRQPRMVFVNSMSDLFHELVPFEFIGKVFYVMSKASKHTFQVLTKRPERMLEFYAWMQASSTSHEIYREGDFPNVWLGVSCEDQRTANERIPLLLETPAAVRFLSCEPLLGEINLGLYGTVPKTVSPQYRLTYQMLDWVIAGGESGPNFRKMDLDWARSLRDQCVNANVPFFYKQNSAYRSEQDTLLDGVEWHQFPKVEVEA